MDAATQGLVGRDAWIERIDQALVRARHVHLHGPPGVGKSALGDAIVAAWRARGHAVARVRWEVSGEPGWHTARAGDPDLIVVDDADAFPTDLLDGAPHVLWISRRARPGAHMTALEIEPLGLQDGVALFSRLAALPAGTDLAEVERLVRALNGLPRAIELAASRARMLGVSALLEYIHQDLGILSQRIQERSTRHRSIRHNMEELWRELGESEQALLLLCSVFPGTFALRDVVVASGMPLPAVVAGLEALVAASALLLHPGAPATFEVLGVMRTYLARHIDRRPSGADLGDARERLLEFIDAQASDALAALLDAQEPKTLEIEGELMQMAARHALSNPTPERVSAAARCLLAMCTDPANLRTWPTLLHQLDGILGAPGFEACAPPFRALMYGLRALLSWGETTRWEPPEALEGEGPMFAWATLLMAWSGGSAPGDAPFAHPRLEALRALECARHEPDHERALADLYEDQTRWPNEGLMRAIHRGLRAEVFSRHGHPERAFHMLDEAPTHPGVALWWARGRGRALCAKERWEHAEEALVSARAQVAGLGQARCLWALDLELARVHLWRGDADRCLTLAASVLEQTHQTDALTWVFLSEMSLAYEMEAIEPTWVHARTSALGHRVQDPAFWAAPDLTTQTLRALATSLYAPTSWSKPDPGLAPHVRALLEVHHGLIGALCHEHPLELAALAAAWRRGAACERSTELVTLQLSRLVRALMAHPKARALEVAIRSREDGPIALFDMGQGQARLQDGAWIAFGHRPKTRRLIEALLEARERGASVSAEALVDHIWPDEQIRYDNALARLYNLLSTTRKLGLGPLLTKDEDGYLLDPDWSIQVL